MRKIYNCPIETCLLACLPGLDPRIGQFGWSVETTPDLPGRFEDDVLPRWLKPGPPSGLSGTRSP